MRESVLKKQDYIQAAKLLARCRKDRLPLVIETLRQGGIEISEEDIKEYTVVRTDNKKRYEYRMHNHKPWYETDDETVLRFRKAYYNGIKISELAEKIGVNRPSLYEYLSGNWNFTPKSKWVKDALDAEFDALGIE